MLVIYRDLKLSPFEVLEDLIIRFVVNQKISFLTVNKPQREHEELLWNSVFDRNRVSIIKNSFMIHPPRIISL